MDHHAPHTQNPHTTRTRDAALRRLGHVNRWLIAGSAALTGAFTAVAANAFPGRTVKPVTTSSAAHASRTSSGRSRASHASGALKPPAQAPRTSETPTTSTASSTPSSSREAATTPQESTPAQESTSAQEATPTQETSVAPAQESAPVTSGGS